MRHQPKMYLAVRVQIVRSQMLRAGFFYILSIFGIILENTMVFVDLSSGMLFIFVVTAYHIDMCPFFGWFLVPNDTGEKYPGTWIPGWPLKDQNCSGGILDYGVLEVGNRKNTKRSYILTYLQLTVIQHSSLAEQFSYGMANILSSELQYCIRE